MSAIKTMDLVLIQDPNHIPQALLKYDRDQEDHPSGYLKDLLRYYREGIPVKDIAEFCGRIFAEVSLRKRLVKNLIIGSHGAYTGGRNGVGFFYIGTTYISAGEGSKPARTLLKRVAPFLARGAHVYIMACKTGNDRDVLQRVSEALGGVSVHGYTDYITTTNWGPFGVSLDDGTDDEGREMICLAGQCHVRR